MQKVDKAFKRYCEHWYLLRSHSLQVHGQAAPAETLTSVSERNKVDT